MNFDIVFVLLALIGMIAALVWDKMRPGMVLLTVVVFFLCVGILTPKEMLEGFSNKGMITVAMLFLVSEGVRQSGALGQLIKKLLPEGISLEQRRFFAIKSLEQDEKIGEWMEQVQGACPDKSHVSEIVKQLEKTFDDDVESIITNERYEYISSMISGCITKAGKEKLTVSDRIDKIVTNRILALPIFAIVMILVYYVLSLIHISEPTRR